MLTSELYEQLTKGIPAPELVSGIVPVYICSECGDYGCGVFGWKISFGKDTVIWSDFGWDDTLDDDITEDEPDPLYARKAITFDRTQYFNALDHIPSNDKLYNQAMNFLSYVRRLRFQKTSQNYDMELRKFLLRATSRILSVSKTCTLSGEFI